MELHVDGQSGEDCRLPTGGEVLGYFADAFRLKECIESSDDLPFSSKTAQRYLNGRQHKVAEATARKIVRHLVISFIPSHVFAARSEKDVEEAHNQIVDVVTRLCTGWDIIAGQINGYRFPNKDPGVACLPSLRLATFSAGICWGAWKFLYDDRLWLANGTESEPLPWWLRDHPFKLVFDHYRIDDEGQGPTLREFVDNARYEIDQDGLTNWRAGKHRPNSFYLDSLSEELGRLAPDAQPDEILFRLRVAAGTAYIQRKLSELCGQARIDDLREGFRLVAGCTCEVLERSLSPENDADREKVQAVIERGPMSDLGTHICHSIARRAVGSHFVAQDLLALPRNWIPRLQWWAKLLAQSSAQHGEDELIDAGVPSELAEELSELNRMGRQMMLRTRDFTDPEAVVIERIRSESNFDLSTLTDPRKIGDLLRSVFPVFAAEERSSVGDVGGSIHVLERAVKSDPQNGELHYRLSGELVKEARRTGNRKILDRAVHECRIAVALKPERGPFHYELGRILAEAHRFEEAEEVYGKSAHLNEDWHIFHAGRGQNLMWLKRYEEALECFEHSLKLEPNYPGSKAFKGICLLAMGNRRKGKPLLREVARQTGYDLLQGEKWKELLDGPVGVRTSHPVRDVPST